jgi:hypothetical protein
LPKALVTTEQEICWATLLAPDIVEAILDGKQGPEVTLARVLEPFPMAWAQQPTASFLLKE